MKASFRALFALIMCFTISFGHVANGQAPTSSPPSRLPEWNRALGMPAELISSASVKGQPLHSDGNLMLSGNSVLVSSGPDEYGYTWDDTVPFEWIDTEGGTFVGYEPFIENNPFGPFPLPFDFKFYETVYSHVYISQLGYVTFVNEPYFPTEIPALAGPNNRIAPYASYFYLGLGTFIRYKFGGTAPDRYIVVEWHDMRDDYPERNSYTYEAVLFENGNILFQYQTMLFLGPHTCGVSGIENQTGSDGLAYRTACDTYPSNEAVLFRRPVPSARIKINPNRYGDFAGSNQNAEMEIPIQNNGELGEDTFDLILDSAWKGALYDTSGTLLTDTDGDSLIDTGPVPQDGSTSILVTIRPPTTAVAGDDQTAMLNVISSVDPTKVKSVILQTAVPAPFVQVFKDFTQSNATMAFIQPRMNAEVDIEPRASNFPGAVAEAPNGNLVYTWSQSGCRYPACNTLTNEIYYAILDRSGRTVLPTTQLTNNSGTYLQINEFDPIIQIAPNGTIGLVWGQYAYDPVTSQMNNSLFLAILDEKGKVLKKYIKLTEDYSSYNGKLSLIATSDNYFQVAWENFSSSSLGSFQDVYFIAFDSIGNPVRGRTKMTADTASDTDAFAYPELTSLRHNRSMLLWYDALNSDLYYSILNSFGEVLYGPTNLTGNGAAQKESFPSAEQLLNGNIFVAYTGNSGIWFVIMNSSYQRIVGPVALNPSSAYTDGVLSLTSDSDSRAILTWDDWEANYNLFYSLVDSGGTILTQPMIFRSTRFDSSISHAAKAANTTFHWIPPEEADLWIEAVRPAQGLPSSTVQAVVKYGNIGANLSTATVLQATVDPNLVVTGYSLPPTSQVDNVYTWNLPNISWLDSEEFYLRLTLPESAVGDQYPIEWVITSADSDANPEDNQDTGQVSIALQVFLPIIRR